MPKQLHLQVGIIIRPSSLQVIGEKEMRTVTMISIDKNVRMLLTFKALF